MTLRSKIKTKFHFNGNKKNNKLPLGLILFLPILLLVKLDSCLDKMFVNYKKAST